MRGHRLRRDGSRPLEAGRRVGTEVGGGLDAAARDGRRHEGARGAGRGVRGGEGGRGQRHAAGRGRALWRGLEVRGRGADGGRSAGAQAGRECRGDRRGDTGGHTGGDCGTCGGRRGGVDGWSGGRVEVRGRERDGREACGGRGRGRLERGGRAQALRRGRGVHAGGRGCVHAGRLRCGACRRAEGALRRRSRCRRHPASSRHQWTLCGVLRVVKDWMGRGGEKKTNIDSWTRTHQGTVDDGSGRTDSWRRHLARGKGWRWEIVWWRNSSHCVGEKKMRRKRWGKKSAQNSHSVTVLSFGWENNNKKATKQKNKKGTHKNIKRGMKTGVHQDGLKDTRYVTTPK